MLTERRIPALAGTADTVAAHALFGVLVRDVAGPAGVVQEAGEHLEVDLLPARLRVRLRARSTVHAHRFTGPVQEGTADGWVDIGLERLLELVAAALTQRCGPAGGQLLDEVRAGRAALAAVLADRPDHPARPLAEPAAGYVDSEQALLAGHPRHPAPKWRSGTPQEWRRWSPEARTAFPLHWFAVRDDLVQEWSIGPSLIDELAPEVPDGHRALPLHPWQARMLAPELAARAGLVDLGPGGPPWHPTSSVRTLYQPEADVFLKTSLTVRITNCVRHSSVADLEGAVLLTRLLAGAGAPGFALLGEPSARTVRVPQLAGRVGVIARCGLGLAPGERAHLAGTLAAQEVDPAAIPTRLADVLQGGDPLDWWDRYVALVVPPVLRLWAGQGVVLEPHLQNVLVVTGTDGSPRRVLLRDMEGVRLRTDRHAALLASLAPPVAAATAYDAEQAAARIGYCLLVNNLGELAVAVAELGGVPEQRLWTPVRDAVAAVAAELGEPAELRQLLTGPTLPAKANLVVRWRGAEDPDAPYVPVPNPLAR
ncbi:IucA/IucC family protein [Pseudonocardia sp. CA-107938]|uniref:IucA/IucC family protein n=1 Tax=Pseudonocardia sp. CA-107938 TaxID=3240021 RepID=UPI003D91C5C7